MSRTKTYWTRWRGALALLGLLLVLVLALALTGCGGEPTAAPTEPPEREEAPTEVAAAATATTAPNEPPPPTDLPTEPPSTATPTEEPTPEPIDDSACITCHTSQETLQALTEEPEQTESLSEGEG